MGSNPISPTKPEAVEWITSSKLDLKSNIYSFILWFSWSGWSWWLVGLQNLRCEFNSRPDLNGAVADMVIAHA
jgi:hypothetical protein